MSALIQCQEIWLPKMLRCISLRLNFNTGTDSTAVGSCFLSNTRDFVLTGFLKPTRNFPPPSQFTQRQHWEIQIATGARPPEMWATTCLCCCSDRTERMTDEAPCWPADLGTKLTYKRWQLMRLAARQMTPLQSSTYGWFVQRLWSGQRVFPCGESQEMLSTLTSAGFSV